MSTYAQYSTEAYGARSVADATSEVRMAFIRKVYLCLTAMLLVAIGAAAVSIKTGFTLQLLTSLPPFAGMIGIFILAIGIYAVRKVPGLNIVAMLTLGALVGVFMSLTIFIALKIDQGRGASMIGGVLGQAFLLTCAVFIGLTSYVFITRSDFSWMYGMLTTGLFILIAAMIGIFLFGAGNVAMTCYLSFGVLLFSGYILYDTSVILHHLQEDEYILGAMSLFFDFVNLFLFILRLLIHITSE